MDNNIKKRKKSIVISTIGFIVGLIVFGFWSIFYQLFTKSDNYSADNSGLIDITKVDADVLSGCGGGSTGTAFTDGGCFSRFSGSLGGGK